MDAQLYSDTHHKLDRITEHPDLDLHLRIQEHRLEGYVWSAGRRFRIMGIRDEEDCNPVANPEPTGHGPVNP